MFSHLSDYQLIESPHSLYQNAIHIKSKRNVLIHMFSVDEQKVGSDFSGRLTSFVKDLDHLHIVRVYEIFEEKPNLFIVLESRNAWNRLSDSLTSTEWKQYSVATFEDLARRLFQQLVSAIDFYQSNIVMKHGDIVLAPGINDKDHRHLTADSILYDPQTKSLAIHPLDLYVNTISLQPYDYVHSCGEVLYEILYPDRYDPKEIRLHPWFNIGLPSYLYKNNNHLKPSHNTGRSIFDEPRSLDHLTTFDYKSVVKRIKNQGLDSLENFQFFCRNAEPIKMDINWIDLATRVGLSVLKVEHLQKILECDPSTKILVFYLLIQIIKSFTFIVDDSSENEKKSLEFTNYFISLYHEMAKSPPPPSTAQSPDVKSDTNSHGDPNKPHSLKLVGSAKRHLSYSTVHTNSTTMKLPDYNDIVLLTDTEQNQCGGFWLDGPIQLKDGFICSFIFTLNPMPNEKKGADGFALVIQSESNTAYQPSALGSKKGYGMFINCVAIEFDTYRAYPNHFISIQSSDKNPNDTSGVCEQQHSLTDRFITNNIGVEMNDGKDHQVVVVYLRESITVFVDGKTVFKCFDHDVLKAVVGTETKPVYIGVTGATGGICQRHFISLFSFQTYNHKLFIKPLDKSLVITEKFGSNCNRIVDVFRWIDFKLVGDSKEVNELNPHVSFSRGAIWSKDQFKLKDGFISTFKIGSSSSNGQVDNPFSFVLQPLSNSEYTPSQSQSFVIKFEKDTVSLYLHSTLNKESHYPFFSYMTPGLNVDDNEDHDIVVRYTGSRLTLSIDNVVIIEQLDFNIQKFLNHNSPYIGISASISNGKSHQLKYFSNLVFVIDQKFVNDHIGYEIMELLFLANPHNIRSHFIDQQPMNTFFTPIEILESNIGDISQYDRLYAMAEQNFLFSQKTKSQIIERASGQSDSKYLDLLSMIPVDQNDTDLLLHNVMSTTKTVTPVTIRILSNAIDESGLDQKDGKSNIFVKYYQYIWNAFSKNNIKELMENHSLYTELLDIIAVILSNGFNDIPEKVVQSLFDSLSFCISNPSKQNDTYSQTISSLIKRLPQTPSLVAMYQSFVRSLDFNTKTIISIISMFPFHFTNNEDVIQLFAEYTNKLFKFLEIKSSQSQRDFDIAVLVIKIMHLHIQLVIKVTQETIDRPPLETLQMLLLVVTKSYSSYLDDDEGSESENDEKEEEIIDSQIELDLSKYSKIMERFSTISEENIFYLIDIQTTFRYPLKSLTEILSILNVELKFTDINRLVQLELAETPLEYIRLQWIKSIHPFSKLEDPALNQMKKFGYQTLLWLIECIKDEAKLQEFSNYLGLFSQFEIDGFESDYLISSSFNENNNLNQWKQSLGEFVINQYYMDVSFKEYSDSELFLELKSKMAELLFTGDWTLATIEPLIQKTLVNPTTINSDLMKTSIRILHTILNYQLSKDDCNSRFDTVSSFFTYPINYQAEKFEELVLDKFFVPSYHKNIIQLIKEFKVVNSTFPTLILLNQYHQVNVRINNGDNFIDPMMLQQGIYSVLKIDEQLSILIKACQETMKIKIRETQVIAMLLLMSKPNNSGRLLQMNTGEGKSLVIAMLTAHLALLGHVVDVITTTSELAVPRFTQAIPLFMKLKLAEYIPLLDFKIKYSGISEYQSRLLQNRFNHSEDSFNTNNRFAILDEVDSMLLDGNDSVVMLTGPTPGIDCLIPILASIWVQMEHIENKIAFSDDGELCYVDEVSRDANGNLISEDQQTYEFYPIQGEPEEFIKLSTEEHIRKIIRDTDGLSKMNIAQARKTIPNDYPRQNIPNHLQSLVKESLVSKWIDSAYTAKFEMEVNKHYILDNKEIKSVDALNSEKFVINTKWRNGLQQFLQLKHGVKITPENLTSNFISNISYIKLYKNNLFGLCGTLGAPEERTLLQNTYNVDSIVIPPFMNKQMVETKPIVVHEDNMDKWYSSIVFQTLSMISSRRAVLIIAEYICQVDGLNTRLSKVIPTNQIKLYKFGNEPFVIDRPVLPGEVIISTSMASRAIDLNSDKIESFGGLHICMTHIPKSERVLQESFGRTSRTGNRGTVQFILLDQEQNSSFDQIKLCRSELESKKLKSAVTEIQQISKKDNIFGRYCKYRESIANNYKTNGAEYILQGLDERFAIWFKKYEDITIDLSTDPYPDFEKKLINELNQSNVITNPYFYIMRGNYLCVNNKDQEAYNEYTKAIQIESNFIANAYYNRAHTILKMDKQRSWETNTSKPNPIEDLKAAKRVIEDTLESQWFILTQASDSPILAVQVRNIMYLYGMLKGTIEDLIGYQDYDKDKATLTKEMNERKGLTEKDKEEIRKEILDLEKRRDTKGLIQVGAEGTIDTVKLLTFNQLLPEGEDERQFKDEFKLFSIDGYMGCIRLDIKLPKPGIQWFSVIGLVLLGAAQFVAGAVITVFTEGIGSPVGVPLMAEGISDIITAIHEGVIDRTFSWKQWGIEKAISVTVSLITAGLGSLKAVGKVAVQAGKKVFSKASGKILANASRKYAYSGLLKYGAKSVTAKQLIKKTMAIAIRDQAIEYSLTQGLNYVSDQLFIPTLIKFIKSEIHPIIQQRFNGNQKLKGLMTNEVDEHLVSNRLSALIETEEEGIFYKISTGIASGLIHSKSVKISILFDILKALKAANDLRTMLPEFLDKSDKEIEKATTAKPLNSTVQARIDQLVDNMVNLLAIQMSDQIKFYMVNPISRRVANHIVTKSFKGDNKQHQDALQAYYSSVIQQKIANGKTPLAPITHLDENQSKQLVDQQIENVKKEGELGIVHFEALSSILKQPIVIHDENGDVTVYNSSTNKDQMPPIELEYVPPNKDNKSGHWIPKGEDHSWKLPGGGKKNNCSLDAIIYSRERDGIHNDFDQTLLRSKLVAFMESPSGRTSLNKQAYYIKVLEETKKHWLYEGGSRIKTKRIRAKGKIKYSLLGKMTVNFAKLDWRKRFQSKGKGGLHELIPMNMRAKNGVCDQIMSNCQPAASKLLIKFLNEGRIHTAAVLFRGTKANKLVDGAMHSSNIKSIFTTQTQSQFHDLLRKPLQDLLKETKGKGKTVTIAQIKNTIKSIVQTQLDNTYSGKQKPDKYLNHIMTNAQRLGFNYFVSINRDYLKKLARSYKVTLDKPSPTIGPAKPKDTMDIEFKLP
ncbi:hypothetical protein PPL_01263 [Heterostelium album PN500]|uniref:Protein translocase subunit SecA n=1 Tax=Heterostelium pallidum (strain ATCC 26659 / Pp 5 / PN500) TaxID=670386 RepID=D3AYK3_HETP5|nr:hypothetical protein PPL_01263 [Heterostelium album PN500]EFA86030.1 hypothetical protein PPL_01263 [Heterostelium album PN500]|eukprot:XP_020438136.1 hypothetical protein PPL_01263 [Heterostelium album PN500]